MHLQHPVPQRVHDQLQRVRVAGVEAVTGSGEVFVEPQVAVEEPVVGGVVDAAEVDCRAQVVALSGVVVDDVEDDLDTGFVKRADHGLELSHRPAGIAGRRVLIVRSEESKCVVAPVVTQAKVEQPVVVQKLVHWHQFDRGDVERLEVVDDRRMGQAGVRPAQFLGDSGMGLSHALDVRLVDDRLVVGRARRAVGGPVEERVDHHAGHGVAERVDHRRSSRRRRVGRRGRQVIGVQRLAEVEVTVERLPVRVQQQLARVTPMAGVRVERPVHAKPVPLTWGDGRQVAMPDVAVDLVEVDPRLGPVLGDQAQLNLLGDLGEQREVGARAVIGGAERIGGARPHRGQGGRRRGRAATCRHPGWLAG